jgi:hypothetical protein
MYTVAEYQWTRIVVVRRRGQRVKLRRWIREGSMEVKIEFKRLKGISDPL